MSCSFEPKRNIGVCLPVVRIYLHTYPQVPLTWAGPVQKISRYMPGDIKVFTTTNITACRSACTALDGKSNRDGKVCKYFSWYPYTLTAFGRCFLSSGDKPEKYGKGWTYMAVDAKLADPPIGEYTIQRVVESVGQKLVLCPLGGKNCEDNFVYTNPAIHFSSPDKEATQIYSGLVASEVLTPLLPGRDLPTHPKSNGPDSFIMESPRKDCQKQLFKSGSSFVGFATSKTDGTIKFYKFDPRLRLLDNTLDSPANVGPLRDAGAFGHSAAQAQCPLLKKNFLNEGKCVRHTEGTCSPLEFETDKIIKLDRATLRLWYTTSNMMVFAVDGLSPKSSPCTPRQRSRWRLIPGTCKGDGSKVDATTKATLLQVLQKQNTMCSTMFSRLPEDKRSYSSMKGSNGKSGINAGSPWYPSENNVGEWLQFNFNSVKKVAGVVVQGRGNDYVTKFKVQRSLNGKDWIDVAGEYDGSKDQTLKTAYFPAPFSAQYVRLVVLDWNKPKRISFRADLLLCRPKTVWNPNIRDVVVSDMAEGKCSTSKNTIGAQIQVTKDTCWQHTHPDTLNVYDFSQQSLTLCPRKDGTPDWYKRNHVYERAETGSHIFQHTGQWNEFKKKHKNDLVYVGRFGDFIEFQNLDPDLQTLPMAKALGVKSTESTVAFDACGSRAEVSNNPLRGNTLFFNDVHCKEFKKERMSLELDFPYGDLERGKDYVYTNIVLKSPDQLRQRIAWALSQIFVLSEKVVPPQLHLQTTKSIFPQ